MREITLTLTDEQIFELVRRRYPREEDQQDDRKVAEALDTLAWWPASIMVPHLPGGSLKPMNTTR